LSAWVIPGISSITESLVQGYQWKGPILETIAVVLIICLAGGYLIRRYVKRAKNPATCDCDNPKCPLKGSGSENMENFRDKMNCESKKCNGDVTK